MSAQLRRVQIHLNGKDPDESPRAAVAAPGSPAQSEHSFRITTVDVPLPAAPASATPSAAESEEEMHMAVVEAGAAPSAGAGGVAGSGGVTDTSSDSDASAPARRPGVEELFEDITLPHGAWHRGGGAAAARHLRDVGAVAVASETSNDAQSPAAPVALADGASRGAPVLQSPSSALADPAGAPRRRDDSPASSLDGAALRMVAVPVAGALKSTR